MPKLFKLSIIVALLSAVLFFIGTIILLFVGLHGYIINIGYVSLLGCLLSMIIMTTSMLVYE